MYNMGLVSLDSLAIDLSVINNKHTSHVRFLNDHREGTSSPQICWLYPQAKATVDFPCLLFVREGEAMEILLS